MDHNNKIIREGKCRGGGEDDDKRSLDVALVINMLGSHFVKSLTLVVTICFAGRYSNVLLALVSQFIIDASERFN